MSEPDLQRFVDAQDAGRTYERALAELRSGRKTSLRDLRERVPCESQGHWMWFVFPQIAGLGGSAMSRRYALSGIEEANAYLAHPILGARLRECASVLRERRSRSAVEIFGSVDAMKLRSCLTLFMRAAPEETLFRELLTQLFGGVADDATDERLRRDG